MEFECTPKYDFVSQALALEKSPAFAVSSGTVATNRLTSIAIGRDNRKGSTFDCRGLLHDFAIQGRSVLIYAYFGRSGHKTVAVSEDEYMKAKGGDCIWTWESQVILIPVGLVPHSLFRCSVPFNELGKKMYFAARRLGAPVVSRCRSVIYQRGTRRRAGTVLVKMAEDTTLGSLEKLPLDLSNPDFWSM